jgi:hypothetical protein
MLIHKRIIVMVEHKTLWDLVLFVDAKLPK